MRLFLGVDGGQSSTIAWIAREDGLVVGSGTSGPCNHVSAAEAAAKFLQVMTECVRRACTSAGLDFPTVQFAGVCCGMSGGPADKTALLQKLLRTEHLLVVTDAEIALAGALVGEPGIVVIAGTGSICLGKNAAGLTSRAGGWGYVFGDEGSAFDIVRQAIRASLRYEEGWGPETALHGALLEACGERSANDVLHAFYSPGWPRARVADLATLVDAAAEREDTIAYNIIGAAAQSLSTLAACVRERIFSGVDQVSVSYTGGVFQSRGLLKRFRLLVELSGCRCVDPALSPVAGALLEAFQLAGLTGVNLLSSKFSHGKTLD